MNYEQPACEGLTQPFEAPTLRRSKSRAFVRFARNFPLQRPAMHNSPPDDSRLDQAEAKMRRALGLGGHSMPSAERPHSASQPADHFHRRGKFVRDGEVQVEIVNRKQHQPNGEENLLDAARQSVRALAAENERIERLLSVAQAM